MRLNRHHKPSGLSQASRKLLFYAMVIWLMNLFSTQLSLADAQQTGTPANLSDDGTSTRHTTPPTLKLGEDQAADEAAAKNAAQNPVAPAISLPFQNNTYYEVGPYRRAENGLGVEPVIPFKLSRNWALITRTITPIEVVPRLSPSEGVDYGLGNIQPQFYFVPIRQGTFLWGAGPQLWLPTATDSVLGINKWGGGPAFAGVLHSGPWVGGVLLNNEFAGVNHRHVNLLTLNPFVFYNMPRGWYLISSLVLTADWTASRSDRWTVPVGGGVGRVCNMGKQPLNARTQFLNDVRTTNGGSDWQLQTQLQLVFLPTKKVAH